MTTRGLHIVSLALLVGGCAAPQRRLQADNRRLSIEVTELRAQARRDRRKIRDLEHRLSLSTAGARPAASASEPVVVQEAPSAPAADPAADPAAEPPPAELAADPPTAEAMTIGRDDDGVEIVYEGEAALPSSARRTRLTLRERSSDEPLPEVPRRPVGELAVVPGEFPTVDAHVRQARSAPPRTRASAAVPVVAPRDEYQRYLAALNAGNHAYARAGLQSFVERHPSHDLADNAVYWLGESYYHQKDYVRAAGEFQRIRDRYPRGNKAADATLKLGYCHAARGQADAARGVLRQVIELYPKSASAQLDGERLKTLGGTP